MLDRRGWPGEVNSLLDIFKIILSPRIHSAEDTILNFIARDEENEKFRLLILLMRSIKFIRLRTLF